MINENININIFDDWASKNKDIGMEKGHIPAVNKMLSIINERTTILSRKFNFLDLGCGNGWVVRKFSNNKLCNLAVGVDGAYNMIKKARTKDKKGIYFQSEIENWNYTERFNIIFSMETFYYFNDVDGILDKVYNDLLGIDSFFIFGIDHYFENKPSLSWEKEIGIKPCTRTINSWVKKVKQVGFKKIEYLQYGAKNNWSGTLIISAKK